jgi:hypothetical protein
MKQLMMAQNMNDSVSEHKDEIEQLPVKVENLKRSTMNTENEVKSSVLRVTQLFHLINFETSSDLDEIHKTVTSAGQ